MNYDVKNTLACYQHGLDNIATVAIKSLYRENAQAHSWWLIVT